MFRFAMIQRITTKISKLSKKSAVGLIMMVLVLGLTFAYSSRVFASLLTNTSIIELGGTGNANPMVVSDPQALSIVFTAATTGVPSGGLSINFSNFGNGTVNATQTTSTTTCQALTGASAVLPGSLSASGSGTTITITGVTSLTASTSYCVNLTGSAVTNPSAAGVYSAVITAGGDSATDAVDVLSAASGYNQYSVTATVAPTFTLALNGGGSTTTDTIGTLSATALTTSSGVTASVSTNAASGWYVWADDSQGGLHTASRSHTISSVSTGSNHAMNGGTIGTEAYALGVTTGNATTNYADAGGTTGGGLSSSTYNEIATNGSAANGVSINLKELVDISPTTPSANDYTDTITLIGAGSF